MNKKYDACLLLLTQPTTVFTETVCSAKYKTKYIILFLALLTTISYSQSDTLDTVILYNDDMLKGKILRIKTESIEFIELSTSIIYEYENKKIKSIVLSNGKIINLNKSTTPPPVQNPTSDEEKEDTIGTQLGIGGGVLFAFKSDNYESGTGANIFLELRAASLVAVRTNLGWYSAETKVDYLSKGNANFYLMELSLLLRSMRGTIQPYGGVGIGYYFIDNKLDNEVLQFFEQYGYGVKEEIENGIGFFIQGGADAMFASNIGFFFEFEILDIQSKSSYYYLSIACF